MKNAFPDVQESLRNFKFRKGDLLESVNYRSNSLTTTLAKTFERLLLQQLLEHVEEHKVINKNYFGFLSNKPSNDTVVSLSESMKQYVEQNETVIGIFCFSKSVHFNFSRNLSGKN